MIKHLLLFFIPLLFANSVQAQQTSMRLNLQDINNANNTSECVIVNIPNSNDAFDQSDALVFDLGVFTNIFSNVDGHFVVINSLDALNQDKVVKIGIYNEDYTGNFNIKATNYADYGGSSMIILVDSATTPPTLTNLKADSINIYNFLINTYILNRFWLKLYPATKVVKPCSSGNSIVIYNPSNAPISYNVKPLNSSISIANATNFTDSVTIGNIANGTYTVSITNQQNAVTIDTLQIGVGFTITTQIIDVSCGGLISGSIQLHTTNGNAPYSYLWNDGSTDEYRQFMPADTYSVLVTDNNGCTGQLNNITVGYAPNLTVNTTIQNIACIGDSANGSISLQITGGIAPYYVYWYDSLIANITIRDSLIGGTYHYIVFDSLGCNNEYFADVLSPDSILIANFETNSNECNILNGGEMHSLVSGGVSPYTYLWNDGDTNGNRDSLPEGNYSVIVTDSYGCNDTLSNITLQYQPALLANKTVQYNLICFGDTDVANIQVGLAGGYAPVTYSWSSNANSTALSLTGINEGSYTFTATDSLGCISSFTVNIVSNATPVLASYAVYNITCYGAQNGIISSNATGGIPQYTYHYNTLTTNSPVINNLGAGIYSIKVTDSIGCSSPVSNLTVTGPLGQFTATINADTLISLDNNLAISANVINNNGIVSYNWTIDDTTYTGYNLTHQFYVAGFYNILLTTTDSAGCVAYDSLLVQVVSYTSLNKVKPQGNRVYVINNTLILEINNQFNLNNLEIVNTISQTAKAIKSINHSGFQSYDLHNYAAGVYVVKLVFDNFIETRKIVIE